MPGLVIHLHLDQHVAREELALTATLLAFPHLHDLFGRDDDLAELVLQTRQLDALFERGLHLVLEIRVGMDDVPAKRHGQPPRPVRMPVSQSRNMSRPQKKMPMISTNTNTVSVVCSVSWRVGQMTLRSSIRDPWMNFQSA